MAGSTGARNGRGQTTRIVVLSGSPFADSRTWSLAAEVGERLAARALDVHLLDLRTLPAADVLYGACETGAVRAALETVERAHGIVVATPVHHAAYSGILKAFLDLLPRDALVGKVALPLAVGGSPGHVLAIDYALRPVLVSLGAAHVTRGHFLLRTDIDRSAEGVTRLQWEAERRLDTVLGELVTALAMHAHGELPVSPPADAAPILMLES